MFNIIHIINFIIIIIQINNIINYYNNIIYNSKIIIIIHNINNIINTLQENHEIETNF